MDRAHWDGVYDARDEVALTWFEAVPQRSLDAILPRLAPGQAVIDIGGGASRLAANLLDAGRGPVSVLDLSGSALAFARRQLGDRGQGVTWIAADITRWQPDRTYTLWHDRAVFHFLTDPADRAAYVGTLDRALAPGGVAVIATFDADGPERCSNLQVVRYAPVDLIAEIAAHAPGRFAAEGSARFDHVTPKGNIQKFQQTILRKIA